MKNALKKIYTDYKKNKGNIVTILQDIQDYFGYIPENTVYWFSKRLDIPASRFFGIATFYAQFHLKPRGKNVITACCGTACHVKRSDMLISTLKKKLKLTDGEDTTDDREFTVERVACVGTCSMAPVVIINKKVYGKITADKLIKEIKILEGKKTSDNK